MSSGRAARRAANKRLSKDPAEPTRMIIPDAVLALGRSPSVEEVDGEKARPEEGGTDRA